MKAVIWVAPGEVRLEEVSPPSIGPGELLLEMRACGLCGTDLAKIFPPLPSPPPLKGEGMGGGREVRLGHELVGVVRALGKGVMRFGLGDRLAVAHHVPCGSCRACLHGNHSMCPEFKATNIDPCGFAELIRVPAPNVEQVAFRLPDEMPDEVGTFVEPLGCAIRAVKRSQVFPGDRIAVFGTGSMGLLIAQVVKLYGGEAYAVDLDEERLLLAEKLGVEAVVNATKEDPGKRLLELGRGEGIDGAILTAVTASTVEAALSALRDGGRVNLFADPSGDPRIPVDLGEFYHRELSLFATYSTTPAELHEAFQLLAEGQIQVAPLITHRLTLDRFEEGIKLQRSGIAIKVLFHP